MATTGKDFIAHWDWAIKKGLMNKNTASAFKNAGIQVLGVLDNWEDTEIRNLDVEDVLMRFQNLRSRDFTPDSLNAYKRRFRNAVESFLSYVDNPSGWKPNLREPTSSKSSKVEEPKQKKTSTETFQEVTLTKVVPKPGLVEFPYPLREGMVVYLHLPTDLSLTEVRRLAAYMKTLTSDFDLDDSR